MLYEVITDVPRLDLRQYPDGWTIPGGVRRLGVYARKLQERRTANEFKEIGMDHAKCPAAFWKYGSVGVARRSV